MIKNQLKTFGLLGLLTGVLLGVGYLLGGYSGLTIGLIFAIIMNMRLPRSSGGFLFKGETGLGTRPPGPGVA